jgi:hypothetical protein
MAVCIGSELRHQLGQYAETFEDRLMLTVTGFGMAGDSLADEYLNETHTYAQSWVELLGEYRSDDIPLGTYKDSAGDTWSEPRRKGYEYNWGRYGATTATLLSDGQHTGLAGQITANKVSHVALTIGPNDFLPDFSGPYSDIYFGNWTQSQIDTHVTAVVGRITTALNTVDTNNAKIILSNVLDYGLAPLTQTFFPDAARRQSVTDVIDVVNAQLLQLASDRNIPLLDLSRLAVDLLGGSSISIGGNVFTASAGVGVQNIFVADGVHPHTGTSAIIANAYLQALNTGYGESIPLFSEQELTTILSLPYSSDTLNFDYPSYVVFTPAVSLSVDNATVAEAGGVATVTATLSAVLTQNVTVNLNFRGTATNANDYTRSATQIVIPAGSTTGSVTLTAVQDTLEEADETIVVDIASVTNAIESGTQQVAVTIDDDDRIDVDFGDAPDTSAGTSTGNYNTLATNNGPSHTVVAGLFLGNTVDDDNGTLQNTLADADDVNGSLPDDEDGVLSPLDLLGTVGAAPTVTLLVTNTTGATALLAGWIDYNRNGVFDNATERVTATVVTGTTDGRVTLTFPMIPAGSAGKTYARFRLSTDAAFVGSPDPADTASDGEVEDYVFSITAPSIGTVDSFLKIASGTNGGPILANGDRFGRSVTSLGDLDGDGVADLAVGANGDETGGELRGAVHVLLMNASGTVKSSVKIASGTNGSPRLANIDFFGSSVTSLGDLDGDGVPDLAVGARGDDTGGPNRGAVHVLLLNPSGTVKSSVKIASGTNGGPTLANSDSFGSSVTSLGDLNGDGVADLAVGAYGDDTGGSIRGAVHVLLMNSNGTVKSSEKIASGRNGGPTLANGDRFGRSVTLLGDLDGDGVADLAVGAENGGTGGTKRGAVHVLIMNSNGTVKNSVKIASGTNGGPTLADDDQFGNSVTSLGDLDGDGVADLAVGATGDNTGDTNRGAVYALLMNSNGTVKSSVKIASGTNGGPTLATRGYFGRAVTSLGDLDGDGLVDLAVGAYRDDTGGQLRGAVHVLFLTAAPLLASLSVDSATLAEAGGVATVTATLSAASTQIVTVNLDFSGTAANVSDYARSATQIVIPAGSTTGSVTLTAVQDTLDETGETIVVDIASVTNAIEPGTQQVAVTIDDDDPAPTVALSHSGSPLAEAGGVATVTATLSVVSAQNVTVDLSFSGMATNITDYTRSATQIVIPAGSTTGSITLTAVQDTLDETGETIVVDIASVTNGNESGTQQAAVTIDNDDPAPTVTLSLADSPLDEAGGVATVTATLSTASSRNVTVDLSVSGTATNISDYTRSDTQILIPAGSTTGSLTLTAVHDTLDEMDETIVANITSVTNGIESGTQQVTATIIDDDEFDSDFGDAPDTSTGTSTGNYNTLLTDNGPSHTIVPGLFLGNSVDGDNGTLQNASADADDVNAALPKDEDGVLSPLNLQATMGTVPTVTLLVTNTTGATAILAGWIDYNRNGIFDNATERTTASIATGTTDGRVTLTFPAVPLGLVGETYARFRLSTDAEFVANPRSTGEASDGEVEDFEFTISAVSRQPVVVDDAVKIASALNGGPTLENKDHFGGAMASLGDLDGDGVDDLAVGVYGDNTGGTSRGAVYLLMMNAGGTVKNSVKIASDTNGGPTLADEDLFGRSVTSMGDLDGDGVTDLAVGAPGDGAYSRRGAVYLLMMNSDGTVKSSVKIASGTNGGPELANGDFLGRSVTSLGDLDGDGITDLAVGATGDDTGGHSNHGAVHVLLLNVNGTVKSSVKIASDTNGGPALHGRSYFGISVTSLGDLDGDGITDLVVGANGDFTGGPNRGAVHFLMLNSSGTVKSSVKIASDTGGGPSLTNTDRFGTSVTSMGDLDGDGVTDLAVGAFGDDTGGYNRGAVHVLLLNSSSTVKSSVKIASGTSGGPTLTDRDYFGSSVTSMGDLDGDGVVELAVGANRDATGGYNRGAVHVLFLRGPQPETLTLPAGGGNYEVLTDGADLVIRIEGGAEQFRQSAASISSLTISGSPNVDIVTVLNDGGVVATPISFIGGGSNDRFDSSLTMGPVTLSGGSGDDTLLAGSQNDILDGGDGVDLVEISGSSITVTNSSVSSADVDTLTSVERLLLIAAGPGSNIDASSFTLGSATIVGSGGSDTLLGGAGNDLIIAGGGRDSVNGGAGNDSIMGNSGRDTLSGGSGNDTILGGRGRDSIDGGLDTDHLRGGGGADTIEGGDGDDRIMGGPGRDVLDGDDGSDTLLGGGGRDNLAGGLGADNLNGSTRDDTFNQKVGPDTLIGGMRPSARPAPVTLLATSSNSKNEPPRSRTLIASVKAPEEIDDAFGDSLLPQLLEM